jgi:hypothetical protein
MPFRSVAQLAASEDTEGRHWRSSLFKATTPATNALTWGDASIGTGTPIYNAYVGNQYEFTPLTGSGNRSIYPGPAISAGQTRHVTSVMAVSQSNLNPATLLFADYLGFYPLIDSDSLDVQTLDNTASLTRYTNGVGVRAFLVVQVPQTANAVAACTVNYTNQDGTAGRSVTFGVLGQSVIGSLCNQASTTGIVSTAPIAPFVPLASGDTGLRSVQSVTFSGGIGGFVNVVLCRPMFHLAMPVNSIAAEKHLLLHDGRVPELVPGAFLQFLTHKNGSGSLAVLGQLDFNWS